MEVGGHRLESPECRKLMLARILHWTNGSGSYLDQKLEKPSPKDVGKGHKSGLAIAFLGKPED